MAITQQPSKCYQLTKQQLVNALLAPFGSSANAINVLDENNNPLRGCVQAIAKEDGGTSAYNVTLHRPIVGGSVVVFVRTID